MSKKMVLVLTLVLLLAFSVVSFAATAPTIELNPIGPLTYASFPQTYNVTGTATFSNPLQELQLQIDGTLHGVALGTITAANSPYSFSFPWTITQPGTYEVKVTGKHGNAWGYDDEEVVVTTTVVVDFPAAPAIAAELLRENGVRGRDHGKYVSMVAHEMGSWDEDENGSWFHGINKSIVVENVEIANPDYAAAVDAYLQSIGAY